LNDPINGVTALQRVGVTFTDQQKEQIKVMVESGHTMDAQKVILKELNTEFGNSARAYGETLPGKLAIFHTAMDNIAETIGGALLPLLTDLVGKAAVWAQNAIPFIENFAGVIGAVGAALLDVRSPLDFVQLALEKVFGQGNPIVGRIEDVVAS